MQPKYKLADETHTVELLQRQGNDVRLSIAGRAIQARIKHLDNNRSLLSLNGQTHEVFTAQDGNKLFIHFKGKAYQLDVVNAFAEAASDGGNSSGKITAPMPGVMLEVYTTEGDEVEEGKALLLFESMKLQTQVAAHISGKVSKIHYGAGLSFERGATLLEITPILNE